MFEPNGLNHAKLSKIAENLEGISSRLVNLLISYNKENCLIIALLMLRFF